MRTYPPLTADILPQLLFHPRHLAVSSSDRTMIRKSFILGHFLTIRQLGNKIRKNWVHTYSICTPRVEYLAVKSPRRDRHHKDIIPEAEIVALQSHCWTFSLAAMTTTELPVQGGLYRMNYIIHIIITTGKAVLQSIILLPLTFVKQVELRRDHLREQVTCGGESSSRAAHRFFFA